METANRGATTSTNRSHNNEQDHLDLDSQSGEEEEKALSAVGEEVGLSELEGHQDEQLSEADIYLFEGIKLGDTAVIQRALRNGAKVNCVRAPDEYTNSTTPLFEACRSNQYGRFDEIIRILLEAGADARWKNIWGSSVITEVCEKGALSTVEMLLNHDNGLLEMADGGWWTPLFYALSRPHVDMVHFLLDRGANVFAADEDGRTVLMVACQSSAGLVIVRRILAAGVDVEARLEDQQTALHCCALRRNTSAVLRELILQHNANMLAVDKDGRTPFDFACLGGINNGRFPSAVSTLLELYGSKMHQEEGDVALHVLLRSAEYSHVEGRGFHLPMNNIHVRLPLGKLALKHLRTLINSLDTELIRSRDNSGKLPIHIACRTNAPVEVLALLLELDSTVLSTADHSRALPLHECCRGNVEYASVRFLVEQGGVGTLGARNQDGALPLHILCGSTNPSLRTVQYLIQSFPGSVTARTNDGQYPFVIAACESSLASLSVVYELVRANPGLILSH